MGSVNAIETQYDGYTFRSRLEARWAAFFNAAGIKYEYEPYSFSDGAFYYVPDFYLPEFDLFVEVKPFRQDAHVEIEKTLGIIKNKIKKLLVLSDLPDSMDSWALYPAIYAHEITGDIDVERVCFFRREDGCISLASPYRKYDYIRDYKENWERFFTPMYLHHGGVSRRTDLHECFTKAKTERFKEKEVV